MALIALPWVEMVNLYQSSNPLHYTMSNSSVLLFVIGCHLQLWPRKTTWLWLCLCWWPANTSIWRSGSVQHVVLCATCERNMRAWAKNLKWPLFIQWTLLRLCAHRRQWTACTVSYHIGKPPVQTSLSWQRYTLSLLSITIWPQKPVSLQSQYNSGPKQHFDVVESSPFFCSS